jgi:hypothetical protein
MLASVLVGGDAKLGDIREQPVTQVMADHERKNVVGLQFRPRFTAILRLPGLFIDVTVVYIYSTSS